MLSQRPQLPPLCPPSSSFTHPPLCTYNRIQRANHLERCRSTSDASSSASSSASTSTPPIGRDEPDATPSASHPSPRREFTFSVECCTSYSKIPAADWNACATSGDELNPFLLHEFFEAMEESGCASRTEGWQPYHLKITADDGRLAAIIPSYLKGHSYGEYIFDQSWAKFSMQALGQPYYPKLQSCVPFSPVPGSRVLIHPDFLPFADQVTRAAGQALASVAEELNLSSAHINFLPRDQADSLEDLGFQKRVGLQYHFYNRNERGDQYGDFEEFLAELKQSKRKNIRQEMKSVEREGLEILRIPGSQMTRRQWDDFFGLYLSTVDKKWGQAYLNREFFYRLGEGKLADHVLMIAAVDKDPPGASSLGSASTSKPFVGAALNLVGSHAIYGRNWGCSREVRHLHFNVCYYNALQLAIERGLSRVEAGAQGEHKLARAYLPATTYSVHYLRDPRLRQAVGRFLEQEAADVEYTKEVMKQETSPFKDGRGV